MHKNKIYKIKENITYEIIEKEVVIVDTNTGRFLNTNLIGFCILKAIEDQHDIEQICHKLSQKFDIAFAISEKIVSDFVKLLEENTLIERLG